MTATVTEDAELGFCSARALNVLLQERPHLCKQLLAILAERMAESQQVAKAILDKERQPLQRASERLVRKDAAQEEAMPQDHC